MLTVITLLVLRSPLLRLAMVKMNDETMSRGVAVCEAEEIMEKGMEKGLRMDDVVLSPAAIALVVLEERKEEEEGGEEKEGELKDCEAGDEDEVLKLKKLQEQLLEMQDKTEFIDERKEKEKKCKTQLCVVVNVDSKLLPEGRVCRLPKLLRWAAKCQEKFAAIIGDGSAVMVEQDLNRKVVAVKVGICVSVVGEANSGGGGGGGGGSE
ncbi:uncharacterized protein MONOS_8429 [Monocercomonoides exilis]|uniref:uncharacterized protein n=1 Tax=Monocercomonoides exilis TaxID=2049356 RepID=UPI003559464C|nr:hypothetical protein MONOS_8429 [Monocercomonoides exilis]|eukprot:MONOS_8429.1-p1 / transcript=MONOS_8429.1 / gene=MONOS_8429 / organism=Monocercomonoides_exilis_PA203 / gene_product=unspecified product / transcript_product=unspecified product / location=Mono_scaffold00317:25223-26050(-) / protein_length=209 / sequence_SO=supercontig / SO=protein_coding / is_pseudo=false